MLSRELKLWCVFHHKEPNQLSYSVIPQIICCVLHYSKRVNIYVYMGGTWSAKSSYCEEGI